MSSAFAQIAPVFSDPEAWLDKWGAQYLSQEFSPVNRALVYPTVTPNVAQRSDSTKPSRGERELLAVWKKVWGDHFKSLPKDFQPAQADVVFNFKKQIDLVYDQLIAHEINYAAANKQIAQAYGEFQVRSQAILDQLMQERLRQEAQRQKQAVPTDSELQKYVESSQKIYLKPPVDKASDQGLTDLQIRIKDSCKTEKIKLEQLKQEQQNWYEVTTSVNEMLKDPYERERAQTVQREQAQKRDLTMSQIQTFIDKNCHP